VKVATIARSLVFRVAALFLLGMIVLQAAIVAAVIWPDGRPLVFRLIDPQEAIEIAHALENVRLDQQALIIAAVNNGGVVVDLLQAFPEDHGMRQGSRLENQFARYAAELEGRAFRVQVRRGIFDRDTRAMRPPVRLLLELRTGQVMTVERIPVVLQTLYSRYGAITGVIASVLLALMVVLIWQVVRPVSRLAAATRQFRDDVAAADVPVEGTAEIRALAEAFNSMKNRITGLVGERTRVLAAIAHDLRTYLTRLRLRADYIDDADQRAKAATDLDEMGQLLDDILLFAQADASNDTDVPALDANHEARQLVELRREMGEDVVLSGPPAPAICRCSPLAFRRILGNLIDNAMRYGHRAKVRLLSGNDLQIIVEDDGPGFPQELAERLTQPFERLEPSRGRGTGGAGLGLAIVKALAESHGGHLAFEKQPDGGLRVVVTLPSVHPMSVGGGNQPSREILVSMIKHRSDTQ